MVDITCTTTNMMTNMHICIMIHRMSLIKKEINKQDGVCLITLNNPSKANGLTPTMCKDYLKTLNEADNDSDVRVIVVTGAGKTFCVGADMGGLEESSNGEPDQFQFIHQTDALKIRKPIIMAINGAAAGLGLIVSLHGDIRFCKSGAKLTTAFAKRGLVAEHGIAWLLPRIVGVARAMDLLFSSRVITAEEAQSMGLVNFVSKGDDCLKDAMEYAKNMAKYCSPASLAAMKMQIYDSMEMDRHKSYEVASELTAHSLTQPDFVEGVQSYLQKRDPKFQALPPAKSKM